MTITEIDEKFMREALAEARAAAAVGEVPIGAVVVRAGEIVARAHNRRELDQDPSAHAEFAALCAAARSLGRWRLSDCTVYVTLEPCCMCAGLMVNARVGRCVYGASDAKAGALGSLYDLNADSRLNHRFSVTAGVLADECRELLSSYFGGLRGAAALIAVVGPILRHMPLMSRRSRVPKISSLRRSILVPRAAGPAVCCWRLIPLRAACRVRRRRRRLPKACAAFGPMPKWPRCRWQMVARNARRRCRLRWRACDLRGCRSLGRACACPDAG